MKTILVVDDQSCVRELLRDVLEGAGYEVLEAGSGHEAQSRAHRADLILLDEQMPGMSGSQTLCALKAAPETAPIPVVMMSGACGGLLDTSPAQLAGYIPKPCSPSDLVRQLQQILAKRA